MIIAKSLFCFKQHLLSVDFLQIIRLPPSKTKYETVPQKGGGGAKPTKKRVLPQILMPILCLFLQKEGEGLPTY